MEDNKAKKAYAEILELMKEHEDVCIFDVSDLERQAENHLFGIKLREKHGFDIEPKDIRSTDWVNLRGPMSVGIWGEKYHRTISFSDDGRQPVDELLLQISFSTGAYIFGNDYPKELFQLFFDELVSYSPKYKDTANKSLYYSMDNASKIHNEYDSIIKKYHELNEEDFKQRKIKRMEAELEELKGKKD